MSILCYKYRFDTGSIKNLIYYNLQMKIVHKISWGEYQKNPKILDPILDTYLTKITGNVAIKTHFGEPGNENGLRGEIVKPVIEWVRNRNIAGFLTDTNTLYTGKRSDTTNHWETAKNHGFADLGLSVEISDEQFPEFTINTLPNQYKDLPIYIGKKLKESDGLICISHVKGHPMFGFGGALKNLGMGGAVPIGKKILHANIAGTINSEKCVLCGTCLQNCPVKAISIQNKKVVIDYEKCIGCGECVTVCPKKAIEVSRKDTTNCQEKTAVYALGVVQGKPGIYINYLININPVCDCAASTKPKILEDLGILISDDPVAIDQASLDWINQVAGKDLFKEVNEVDYNPVLEMGEKIGLGSRDYKFQ